MPTSNEKRKAICEKYSTIIGRNIYSQNLRDYCFKKYKDGKYYSDCSSSISYAYKECGYGFGILNTVGMIESSKFTDVPALIRKGKILNPKILREGDLLLFAGSDSSRRYAGYVGHVEMVYSINPDGSVTICGHGSGNPSYKDMDAYLEQRYASKSSTNLGHKGLIEVRRYIQDDGSEETGSTSREYEISTGNAGLTVTANSLNIRCSPTSSTIGKTYSKGDVIKPTAKEFCDGDPWYKTDLGWCSGKYVTGWVKEIESDNKWWYVDEGYTALTGLHKINDKYYFFDNSGWLVTDSWVDMGDGRWMYANSDGEILCDGWVNYKDKWYYLDSDGYMVSGRFIIDDGDLYYLQDDGTMFEGGLALETDENGAMKVK